ncbi:carbon storage regulator, CsrA [Singulisphaera sp. GP187]|uniref:carbon storage regulator n=1 Tax=Singulisphaera sp. GP187 TaxID=1882752 RepID=UPI0009263E6B|nr:carbon storage regulator [Singulisphaera sp. GP187]SIO61215.1 carbon storage regulator, CsrA [Singulisphaera sp. GP187]
MLVLSRKRMEQIVIGSDIRITVVKLEGGQVRLGIEAPSEVMVLREELLEPRVEKGTKEAAPVTRTGRPKR